MSFIGDPWRESTVSADGHFLPSTKSQPISVSDGFHCSDLLTSVGLVDSTVLSVQNAGLAAIGGWLKGSVPSTRDEGVAFAREH